MLREFQSRPPRENGMSPERRNKEEKGPTTSPLLTARARGQSSWELGSRGGAGTPTCTVLGVFPVPSPGHAAWVLELRQQWERPQRSPAVSWLGQEEMWAAREGADGSRSSWSKERVSPTPAHTPHSAEARSALTRWRMRTSNY